MFGIGLCNVRLSLLSFVFHQRDGFVAEVCGLEFRKFFVVIAE